MTTDTKQTETRTFEADVSRLLHMMVHSVYSDRDVFLRELISNAADACEKLRFEAVSRPELLGDCVPAGCDAESLLGVLLVLERRGRPFPGRTFWSYMLLYGVSRFIIEFYRGDSRGMVFDMLSTSQLVSVILVPLAIVMLLLLSRRLDPTRQSAAQRVAA